MLGKRRDQFDFEAAGSRFTMRPALAIQFGGQWREESESRSGVARDALVSEFGEGWLAHDDDLGDVRVIDGARGRGAAGWIPVLEWLGSAFGEELIGLGVGAAARAGIRRIRIKIKKAKKGDHLVLISRGLAAFIAMDHVFESTDETEVLHVEFAQEPSVLGGRAPMETSYTGYEPWIVSLVNGSRKIRYVLVVNPDGGIVGCITAPAGEFDHMFGLLPPVS
jgi:hypothetical protein